MMFYRVATMADFEKAKKEFVDIPDYVKAIIKDDIDNVPKACKELRTIYGYGLMNAKTRCDKYLSFLKARSDFYHGHAVYTEY